MTTDPRQLADALAHTFTPEQLRQLHDDAVNEQDSVTHRDPWLQLVDALFVAAYDRPGCPCEPCRDAVAEVDAVTADRTLHAIDAPLDATRPEDTMTADLGPAANPRTPESPEDRMRDARPGTDQAINLTEQRLTADARAALYPSDRVSAPRPTITDARRCHTTDQHHHTDGLEADLRSAQRAIAALEKELAKQTDLKERYARTAASLVRQRDNHAAQADRMGAQVTRLRAQLADAQELIAELRNNRERDDRAFAAYDTRQEQDAVTITLDNSTGTFTPTPGSPADHAQGDELPAWVLELVRGLDRYEVEHPKLFRYIRPGVYEPWDCPAPLLALVPVEVRRLVELPEQVPGERP
jgi:hypothetical protein